MEQTTNSKLNEILDTIDLAKRQEELELLRNSTNKIIAETAKLNEMRAIEAAKLQAETARLNEIRAIEAAKLQAETAKLITETKWYPMVVGAAFATALITFTKLVL